MPEPHAAADNVSRVARLGKMDVKNTPAETLPRLQEVRDLGAENKKGKAMTDRAELIARLRTAQSECGKANYAGTFEHARPHQALKAAELALGEAIAALEAKPEPPNPLPESVEEWIDQNHFMERSSYTAAIFVDDVRAYITQLHSQHQAELAAAKEQGRREALQDVPVEALVFADDTMESEWINTIEDAAAGRIAAYRDDIKKLIESARAAQEGGGG